MQERPIINTAAEAAKALQPLAGNAAGILFAVGVIGVGFLAVPVMTIGAAYDLCQTFGWKHGLHVKPREARKFYFAITIFTLLAMGLNFFGIKNEGTGMGGHCAGLFHSFSDAAGHAYYKQSHHMGKWTNTRAMNVLGWATTAAIFAAMIGLVITSFS